MTLVGSIIGVILTIGLAVGGWFYKSALSAPQMHQICVLTPEASAQIVAEVWKYTFFLFKDLFVSGKKKQKLKKTTSC